MTATRRLRCDDTVQVVCANKLTHTHVPTCTHQGPRSKIIAPTHGNDIWGNGPYTHGWLERLNRLGHCQWPQVHGDKPEGSDHNASSADSARAVSSAFRYVRKVSRAEDRESRIEIHHNAPLSQIKSKMVRSGEIGEIRENRIRERLKVPALAVPGQPRLNE